MTLGRRQLLLLGAAGAASVTGCGPALVRHAGAADVQRFDLGVASGQPHAAGMVLWTRLTGADLPAQVPVEWELAEDDAFRTVVARGTETAVAEDAHTVHAEPSSLKPARWYWYRFTALGQRSPPGRTRTAPEPGADVKRFDFLIASCQRWDVGHYAAWRDAAAQAVDAIFFLGDYIYEYPATPGAVRPTHTLGKVRSLSDYRTRYALHKSDPHLQAAHAAAPWLLVWDDHEVDNDYAGLQGQDLQVHFAAQRAAAYRAYWEHMPLPQAARPVNGDMRMHGSLDWGRLARILLLDDRQYRDPQACPKPGRGGSNTVRASQCPDLADPRRSLLGRAQEDWLAQSWSADRPWNLLAQQTLMSRFNWRSPSDGGPEYWTDGWDGYAPARQRLLDVVAQKKLPGAVVLGGDVHANYVASLMADFNRPDSAVIASEFCGTSISSLGLAQDRVDRALPLNPHVLHGRADERGTMRFTLQAQQLQVEMRVVDDARKPDSAVRAGARFLVEAGRPGPQRIN
jgi:alkaline phosphatase D